MKIEVNENVTQKFYDEIVQLLIEYNLSKTEHIKNEINKPIEIIVKNDEGKIIGGLYGRSLWGTLEIKTFVVNSEIRNKGIGTKLIKEVEKEAKKRNCRYISLDTFSFQAPKFYEKLGFEIIGIETDFPSGYEKYYYRKIL